MAQKALKGQELIEQAPDTAATQKRPTVLRVGEVARRSGVGVEALRFYARSGLLDRPARTENGYRLYDEEVLERLAFIKRAQALGFSLANAQECCKTQPDCCKAKQDCCKAKRMSEAFEQIALELRRQYSIGYTPSNFVADGKWRRIEVKLTPPPGFPRLMARSRKGYYALGPARRGHGRELSP